MRMNSGIILSGQQPDIIGQMDRGYTLGRKNALSDLYREHGAGIASGDQGSLNALAQFDPMAAQTAQSNRQSMDQSSQRFKWDAEKMQMMRDQAKAQAMAQAQKMDAAEAAAANEKLTGLIQAGSMFYQKGDKAGFERFAAENGLQIRFDDLPAHLARAIGTKDALDALAGPKPADEYGRYAAEEQAAGRQPLSRIQYAQAKKGGGLSITTPDGMTITQGGPAMSMMPPQADKPKKDMQRRYDPETGTYVEQPIVGSETDIERKQADQKAALAASDYDRKAQIVNSNIDKAIASIEENGRWVAGYGSLLSGLPETEARNFQAVLDTVKANLGFGELQAMRDSSPTGGALGQVSEREIAFLQAIEGNLDTAQSPEQLLEVLKEIKTRRAQFAQERAEIMAGGGGVPSDADQSIRNAPQVGQVEDGFRFMGGNPSDPNSWERAQ